MSRILRCLDMTIKAEFIQGVWRSEGETPCRRIFDPRCLRLHAAKMREHFVRVLVASCMAYDIKSSVAKLRLSHVTIRAKPLASCFARITDRIDYLNERQ